MMKQLSGIERKPFEYTMSLITGKWKMRILFLLHYQQVLRYSEIKRELPKITHKMLSSQLKELEHDWLIKRKVYNQIPPKVEYSLSDKGKSLMPALFSLCHWGRENYNDNPPPHHPEKTLLPHL